MLLDEKILYDWEPEKMVEVLLKDPDDFLKVKETLSRIGIGREETKTLTQSCHIFHRKNRYYIVSFKEMFMLNGVESTLSIGDVARRNLIAHLLSEWGLVEVINKAQLANRAHITSVKIVPYKEKSQWTFKTKYKLGK